jgi:hypothetical protein
MKVNDWSVVRSPIGISLRHLNKRKEVEYAGEVCVSVVDGMISIAVYADSADEAVSVTKIPTSFLKPKEFV